MEVFVDEVRDVSLGVAKVPQFHVHSQNGRCSHQEETQGVELLQVAVAHKGLLLFSLNQELTCALSRGIFLCYTVSFKSIHLDNYLLHGGLLVGANFVVEESTRENE